MFLIVICFLDSKIIIEQLENKHIAILWGDYQASIVLRQLHVSNSLVKNTILNILQLCIEKLQWPAQHQNSTILCPHINHIEKPINLYLTNNWLRKICVNWLKRALVTYHNEPVVCCAENQEIKLIVKIRCHNLMTFIFIIILIVSFPCQNIPVEKLTIFKARRKDLILATEKQKVYLRRMSNDIE